MVCILVLCITSIVEVFSFKSKERSVNLDNHNLMPCLNTLPFFSSSFCNTLFEVVLHIVEVSDAYKMNTAVSVSQCSRDKLDWTITGLGLLAETQCWATFL